MLVSELLRTSLRKIGVVSSGETIESTRQSEALSAAQSMLRSWGAISTNIFATINESKTLVPSTALYTWGTRGDIATSRPSQVIGAYILDSSGTTHPVDIIKAGAYRNIPVKATTSRPHSLYYHSAYPLGEVNLYPVPSTAEDLYLESYKPFTETGSFGLATDTLVFPGYYEEAIIYNLAIRLAPEYGKLVSAEVALIAKSSKDIITLLHATTVVEPVYIHVPASGGYGSRYSINTDGYR